MTRSHALAFALVLTFALLVPASGSASTTAPTTLYFHSATPLGTAEVAQQFATGSGAPRMDAVAPGTGAPHVFAGEATVYLVGYDSPTIASWDGAVHGNVSHVRVTLYGSDTVTGLCCSSVSIYADGALLAQKSFQLTASPTTVDVPAAGAVDHTLRVSVGLVAGGAILYDSSLAPSSVSFDLGPYDPVSGGAGGPAPAWTPAAGWGPVRVVSTTLAARETSLVVDPTNNGRMWLCAPSGVPNIAHDQSYFYKTTDNGATWAYTRVETSQTDVRNYTFEGGDCDVAYDAAGTMYTADTWLGDLSVGHSTDGGVTWAGTPLAVTSPVVDRPWLVGGPAGTIHVTYQDVQFGMPTAIWYTRSTDGGNSFLPAVPVAVASTAAPFSWEGNFVVSPDQTHLYQVFTRRANGVVGVFGPAETVWIASSSDSGLTWTTKQIASMPSSASYLYPSIAMDAAGHLHVVYASATSSDQPVWYQFSMDGSSWTTPVAIMRGVSAYDPWIAAGASGDAVIEWLGTPATKNATTKDQDWYFYAARVTGADTATPTFSASTTTTTPIFHGTQGATPEFNQVRLDANGKMRLGMSVYYGQGSNVGWAELYQAEN